MDAYGKLTRAISGTGLQAHHLLERRFAGVLGEEYRQMLSMALTKADHHVFTKEWRQLIPYGAGTSAATADLVRATATKIYANHPGILRALGL